MTDGKDKKQAGDRSHIYDGWAARPADDSFWRATNIRAPQDKPSPFAQRQEAKNEGPKPSNG